MTHTMLCLLVLILSLSPTLSQQFSVSHLSFSFALDEQEHFVNFSPFKPLVPQAGDTISLFPELLTMQGACSSGNDADTSDSDDGSCVQNTIVMEMEQIVMEHIDGIIAHALKNKDDVMPTVNGILELQTILLSGHFDNAAKNERTDGLGLESGTLRVHLGYSMAWLYNHLAQLGKIRSGEALRTTLEVDLSRQKESRFSHDLRQTLDTLSSFQDFDDVERGYAPLMAALTSMAVGSGEEIEGGMWIAHGEGGRVGMNSVVDKRKRECVLLEMYGLGDLLRTAGEIGFNAGHSSGMYLSMFPDLTVSAFDICEHGYTRGNAAYLKEVSNGRLELTCGDSLETVGSAQVEHGFDFFMVDGHHGFTHAKGDIVNGCGLMRADGLGRLVVDDCDHAEVRRAWNEAVEEGTVVPSHEGLCWEHICIGRCGHTQV